jgi:3-methyladenine DNA glycosylase AlkD
MNPVAEAEQLQEQLVALGDTQRAASERAYLKSRLVHLGAAVPAVRSVATAWSRANPMLDHDEMYGVVRALWEQPVHERRLLAVELLQSHPALVVAGDLPQIEALLRDCATWALVDPLAGSVVADLATRDRTAVLPVLDRWVVDDDFWLRRSAVLALRSLLRHDEQLDRFFDYANLLLPEHEFFIRKVLGWVLREVAPRHPREVSAWLRANMAAMNLVTLREPLRKLPDAEELRALYDNRRNSPG